MCSTFIPTSTIENKAKIDNNHNLHRKEACLDSKDNLNTQEALFKCI